MENTVDWKESKKILKAHAETTVHSSTANFEIQYGLIERPTHQSTSWDQAKFEVSGQKYADISQPDYGIALVNDSKYGYSVYQNSIELSLLRSPKAPDPEADMTVHTFTYGYFPHEGELAGSGAFEAAHALNSPLITACVQKAPATLERSLYSLKGANVKIEAVKTAENGKGTVLRMYETSGTNSKIDLQAETPWKNAVETDMLENPIGKPAGPGSSIALKFGPFEIKTLLLT